MNKEWQEAANEYLKVRGSHLFLCPPTLPSIRHANSYPRNKKLSPSPATHPPTTRARARFSLLPRTLKQIPQGSGSSSEWSKLFPLSLERAEAQSFPHGLTSMYKMIFRRSIGPAGIWMEAMLCEDVNMWCCTRIFKSPSTRQAFPCCLLVPREQCSNICLMESGT